MKGLLLSGIPELIFITFAFMLGHGDKYVSVLMAALIHELGHICMAAILGVKMKFLKTGIVGISLKYHFTYTSPLKEAAVCLAGPLMGVVVFFLGFKNGAVSYFTAASLGLTVFNLLPISFLDGGCALSAVLSIFLSPDTVWKVCRVLSVIFTIILWCAAVMLMLHSNGDISAMTVSIYLLYRLFSEC